MTKKTLKISSKLSLPIDAVTSTMVIYGGKGMGKTNLASVLVEEFAAARLRFAVIDPMGVWWGLRHSADGKAVGVEVLILGGIHGDLPIEPTSGAVVADLVVDEDTSVIIDISRRPDGSMWSIGERVSFMTTFAKRVYQRQGEKRRPLNIVIDEAARFAPQVVRQGDLEVAKCMGAVAVIVEEGRNVGVGVTLVTQRSARLNKDVAELADCMIAFRTVGPNSMRAVLDWLGEHVDKGRIKEIGQQLRELPRGSALVVSPGWLEFEGIVAMRMRETFDSSATPKNGQQVRASGPGAKPDLAKYRERLAEVVERQKMDDPIALRKRLAELGVELERALRVQAPAPGKIKTVEKVVVKDVQIRRVETAIKKVDDAIQDVSSITRNTEQGLRALLERSGAQVLELARTAALLRDTLARATQPSPLPAAASREPTTIESAFTVKNGRTVKMLPASAPHRSPAAARDASAGTGATFDGSLEPRQLKILNAIAWWESIGELKPPASGVAFIAGYSPTSSSFERARGFLRGAGLVSYPTPGTIELTIDGGKLAQYPTKPGTIGELHAAVLEKLEPRQRKLLEPLLECHPSSMAIADHAGAAGYSADSSSYERARGFLRGLGIVEYPKPGHVRATDLLFPPVRS